MIWPLVGPVGEVDPGVTVVLIVEVVHPENADQAVIGPARVRHLARRRHRLTSVVIPVFCLDPE